MLYQNVTNVSFESFWDLAHDKKIILLYPWTNYRNLFLSYFLNGTREGLIYYRLPDEAKTLAEWLAPMCEDLAATLDGFGANLRQALDGGKPAELAAALAADMAAIPRDDAILFIDELDRAPQDGPFRTFVTAFAKALPDNRKLVINSRLLTYQPWIDMINRDEVAVFGTAHRRSNLMFTREDDLKPQLEVYAFGRGHVLVNGREITNWDGALPRNLFFFFIDNRLVTRDQIFDVFWPNLSIKEATNVFHVTKRKITERISTNVLDNGNYELTQYTSGFYMPSKKVIRHYDVEDFTEAIEQALITDDVRIREQLYRRAIDIYKAPFLQTLSIQWIEDRREKLRLMYADALIGMGRLYSEQQAHEKALGFFIRALREMPGREDIYRDVMNMYWQLGRTDDAIEQYRMLEDHLDRTIGIPPSRPTRELYTEITQGH